MSKNYRADFPIFQNQPQLVYLDSASSTQKPDVVIEAVHNFYRNSYANVHRGLYPLSTTATTAFETARKSVAEFVGASSEREIIFTKNATEGINLLATTLSQGWQSGDSIIISEYDHHANLVPWLEVASKKGVILKYIQLDKDGKLDLTHFASLLDATTRLVSLSPHSNVLGTLYSPAKLKKVVQQQGSQTLILTDASQAAAHYALPHIIAHTDFLVFSSHKVYGPSGVGVLWGKEELLETLPPYQTGGDMIKSVSLDKREWNELPWKFEAGTPNIEGVIGLGEAVEYLMRIGMIPVAQHLSKLTFYALTKIKELSQVHLIGQPHPGDGLISFTVDGIHPHDLADLLGQKNICIRAGHHCAMPLHTKFDLVASNRISFGIYTTPQDIDHFIEALQEIITEVENV